MQYIYSFLDILVISIIFTIHVKAINANFFRCHVPVSIHSLYIHLIKALKNILAKVLRY